MAKAVKQKLTHSRIQCFKQCRRKHYFSYVCGLRKITDSAPLRMGSAYHAGQETIGKGGSSDDAVEAIRSYYQDRPDFIDELEWAYERVTVECLMVYHQWRWQHEPIEHIETEKAFALPLVNPATGRRTNNFDDHGKIDGIVRVADGRLLVREIKLLGEDISQGADIWTRLRLDNQITRYLGAARQLGYEVDAVLFDCTRKPASRPTPVPLLDDDGLKVVLDADDNRVFNKPLKDGTAKPRQTADTELGYRILTRPMSADEWQQKLCADIFERPDNYYHRQEVARLDDTLLQYRQEVWDIQRDVRDAELHDKHYRTVDKHCTHCPYFSICERSWKPGDYIPEGMEVVEDVHRELTETPA